MRATEGLVGERILEYRMNEIVKAKLKKTITDRLSNDSGTASVEFVLWLPVMALLFSLVVDTSLIFGSRSQILRVVQDTNRAVSIGRIRTTEDAEAMIIAAISNMAPNATVETYLSSGIITSIVTIPVGDLTGTKVLEFFSGFNVTVGAQHLAET